MTTKHLSLSFQFKDSCFSLCATIKGTSKRHYKEVPNLINPDFNRWDKKQQSFVGLSVDAIHNNGVLREMRERYQRLIDEFWLSL
jgi:hypothetical protein